MVKKNNIQLGSRKELKNRVLEVVSTQRKNPRRMEYLMSNIAVGIKYKLLVGMREVWM